MPAGTEAQLTEVGIELLEVFLPVGNYLGCKQVGNLLYVGGHGPTSKGEIITGKVGGETSLDRVKRVVKVFGMVNTSPGFNQTPAVIEGASDVLVKIFGEAGPHTRSAAGMAELPFDISVEIEMVLEVE
ncbi:MAG: RidA family protein [Candidatus Binatia bacterium]|nr:RidA family protein [Candidatus Binatia bacterium]